jgi:hypothetical protein
MTITMTRRPGKAGFDGGVIGLAEGSACLATSPTRPTGQAGRHRGYFRDGANAPLTQAATGFSRLRVAGREGRLPLPGPGRPHPKNTCGRIKGMSEPTGKYSITMPRDIAEAARARSGPSGLSGYVAAAVARQIERDNLNELIAVAEAEHGPITEEEVRARRSSSRRARAGQGHPRSGAA